MMIVACTTGLTVSFKADGQVYDFSKALTDSSGRVKANCSKGEWYDKLPDRFKGA